MKVIKNAKPPGTYRLFKVISGGQTGVDIAALRTAQEYGFKTGGTMPKGWMTLDGPKPEWGKRFNMKESLSPLYPPRTRANVMEADATLRIFTNAYSPGEKLTEKVCRGLTRPYLNVDLIRTRTGILPFDVANWLTDNRVEVLNVAGNSEQTSPGIELRATIFLRKVFKVYTLADELADTSPPPEKTGNRSRLDLKGPWAVVYRDCAGQQFDRFSLYSASAEDKEKLEARVKELTEQFDWKDVKIINLNEVEF